VPWSTAGYSQPAETSFQYVYDRTSLFYTNDYTDGTLTEVPIHREAQVGNEFLHVFAQDAYRDTRGRIHVLYHVQGSSTGGALTGRHAIIQDGQVVKDVQLEDVWCPNTARLIQDTTGKFYLFTSCGSSLYIWPADSIDGTQVDAAVTVDLGQHPASSWFWLATPRGGTPLADYVDGAYAAGQDSELVYFRIRLRSSASLSSRR
jgi:hypothetical protein